MFINRYRPTSNQVILLIEGPPWKGYPADLILNAIVLGSCINNSNNPLKFCKNVMEHVLWKTH